MHYRERQARAAERKNSHQVKLLPEICKGYDIEIVALFDWQPDSDCSSKNGDLPFIGWCLAGRWGLSLACWKLWASSAGPNDTV